MKTLDELVIGRNGLWFTPEEASKAFQQSDSLFMYDSGGSKTEPVAVGVRLLGAVISKEQFQQRAKELGFVGRYRWGVAYPTSGKNIELGADVLVDVERNGECLFTICKDTIYGERVSAFKITDQRYKPTDTSYLDKPDSSTDNGADWYDYDNQEMKTLPDSNSDVELLCGGVYRTRVEYIGIRGFKVVFYRYDTHEIDHAELPTASFRPLDHDRKAKAERKRVVDAALAHCDHIYESDIFDLYDAGFLRLPD